jgi:CheY-like chemotaxis protein
MGNRKILIVEDDDDIRETLVEVCRAEGQEVASARHGREALDLLKAGLPGDCIVLLDLMMPVMDGKSFLDAIETEIPGRRKDLFIVVFSAGGFVSHPLIKGFLKKPVNLDEVIRLLNGESFLPEPGGFTAPPDLALPY